MTFRTIRVFVSSTFRDMHAERDHLVRFVFPRLRAVLLRRRIHLVDVDLRWGVTSEQNAVSVCRDIIDECRPRFICILGGRYGWVPPGKTDSITADEIRYGVLDRALRDRGFAFFYFRDEAATASMREDHPGEYHEPKGSVAEQALRDLKSSIVAAGFDPFVYDACWDDRSSRLVGLDRLGQHVFDDVLDSVAQEFGDEAPAEGADAIGSETAFTEAFVDQTLTHFVLGSRAATELRLLAYARGDAEGYLCLVGEPGSGKSTLLAHLLGQLAQSAVMTVISHFVGAGPNSADVEFTLRRLCRELGASDHDDASALRAVFAKALEEVSKATRLVLVIDGVNGFGSTQSFFDLNWLPRTLPLNCRIIVSTTPVGMPRPLREHEFVAAELALGRLAEADKIAIADQFLHRFGKTMTAEQRTTLLGKTDADLPLYLLTALEEVRTLGTYEEISQRLTDLPARTLPLFEWIFARLESDDGFRDSGGVPVGRTLTKTVIASIAASRGGVSEEELCDVLAAAMPDANNPHNIAALLLLLRPFLIGRNELIDFYHDQVRAAAAARYLRSDADHLAAHRLLARLFLAKLRAFPERGRAGDHVLYHLRRAEMWNDLVACLGSPDDLARLSPRAYGVNFDAATNTHTTVDEESLTPKIVATIPSPARAQVAQALADGFIARAKEKIKLTQTFKQPWHATCQRLRETDPQGFLAFRDAFYLFIRFADLAYSYAVLACEGMPERAARFFEQDGGSGAFLRFLELVGYEETGLSHAIEDDAGLAHDHVVRLARIRDGGVSRQ